MDLEIRAELSDDRASIEVIHGSPRAPVDLSAAEIADLAGLSPRDDFVARGRVQRRWELDDQDAALCLVYDLRQIRTRVLGGQRGSLRFTTSSTLDA